MNQNKGISKFGWRQYQFNLPREFPVVAEVEVEKGSTGLKARMLQGNIQVHLAPGREEVEVRTLVISKESDPKVEGFAPMVRKRICIGGRDVWVSMGDLNKDMATS